jgi:hypothetical protein
MTLDELKKGMTETNRIMARNLAEQIYGDNWLTRAFPTKPAPLRVRIARRVAGWVADRLIAAASWLKGYDVTGGDY